MIRTCDLLIRSQALYPAELRVRNQVENREGKRKGPSQNPNEDYPFSISNFQFSILKSQLFCKVALPRAGDEFGIANVDTDRAPFAVAFFVCGCIFQGVERAQFGGDQGV